MQFELKTGRTHQIRVHCAYMHHPIVGDKLYNPNVDKFKLNGQLLHAKTLIFNKVSDNTEITVDCPLPDYFIKVLDKFIKLGCIYLATNLLYAMLI